jgi:hypothetical protein
MKILNKVNFYVIILFIYGNLVFLQPNIELMNNYKHNTKRTFIAWLLLALFMMPMVTKAVHVCNIHDLAENCNTKAASHNVDSCSICHFAFFSFNKAENIVFNCVLAVTSIVAVFFFKARYSFEELTIVSLRAPPYHI